MSRIVNDVGPPYLEIVVLTDSLEQKVQNIVGFI